MKVEKVYYSERYKPEIHIEINFFVFIVILGIMWKLKLFVSSRSRCISEFTLSHASRECELSVMAAFEVGDFSGE